MVEALGDTSFIIGIFVSVIEFFTGIIFFLIITNKAYAAQLDDPDYVISSEDGASSMFYAEMSFEGFLQVILLGTHGIES